MLATIIYYGLFDLKIIEWEKNVYFLLNMKENI